MGMVTVYRFKSDLGGKPVRINLKVNNHLHKFYRRVSVENDVSLSELLAAVLEYGAKQDLRLDTIGGLKVVDKLDIWEKKKILEEKYVL